METAEWPVGSGNFAKYVEVDSRRQEFEAYHERHHKYLLKY